MTMVLIWQVPGMRLSIPIGRATVELVPRKDVIKDMPGVRNLP